MMGNRREEERNEKIIRGLLKLPPNRKCINCNSLGPQYVCTNFWTFVCITCSGIHREFTHRVKSVSMCKFTSQEVEALQRGGNQRAREIYLRDWDMQHQRLPASSNIERVREFIKTVYVDRKYTTGKSSDKPPRDMQGYNNHEDERRASSYHSYSQSPPYDYQYEERRYGKQAGMLARKPSLDRVQYHGSFSGIAYSPGRATEDRFANEDSTPRFSDYSVSSAGEGSRHGIQSPAFGRDSSGYSSPLGLPVRNILIEDGRRQTLNMFLDTDSRGISGDLGRPPHTRRPASSESFGSFDSSSPSMRSVKSGSLVDVIEREQPIGMQLPASFPSTGQTSAAAVGAIQDPFGSSVSNDQPPPKPTQSLDLFAGINNPVSCASLSGQHTMAASSPDVDLFAEINNPVSSASMSSSLNLNVVETPSRSLCLFAEKNNPLSPASLSVQSNVTDPSIGNDGWATFDMPQNSTSNSAVKTAQPSLQSTSDPKPSFDSFSLASSHTQQTSAQGGSANKPGCVKLDSDPWNVASQQLDSALLPSGFQPWNAFGDAPDKTAPATFGNFLLESEPQIPVDITTNSVDSCLKGHDKDNFPVFSGGFVSWNADDSAATPPVPLSACPLKSQGEPAQKRMSKNPFDFPSESDSELTNPSVPLDMSSLRGILPNPQFSNSPSNNMDWFPQFSLSSGGLSHMVPPNSQMPNLPAQSQVASLGGNPFA